MRALHASLALCASVLACAPTAQAAAPVVSLTVDGYAAVAGVPTALGIEAQLAVDPGTGTVPLLRRLDLSLPAGFALHAPMGGRSGGLVACTASAFAAASAEASSCPESSRIGTASATLPGVGVVSGPLSMGTTSGTSGLPGLLFEASEGASPAANVERIKLAGALVADPNGQLTVQFAQIGRRFSSLRLGFDGGVRAPLVSPPSCGTSAALATATAAGDGAAGSDAETATISSCQLPPFGPTLTAETAPRTAATPTRLALEVERVDRTDALTGFSVPLPSGLLAAIGEVPECTLAGVEAGTCDPATSVGRVALTLGAGTAPLALDGTVSVVPRGPGDVAQLAIGVPVRLDGVDLGRIALPVRVTLRPTDAGLTLTGTLPAVWRGLSLQIRRLRLDLDRAGFVMNPSACGPLPFRATMAGALGSASGIDASITTENCAALPFAPTLSARLGGELGPLGHPNVTVALDARAGDSHLRAATVTLPEGVLADTANLRNTCSAAQFAAVACSAATRIGTTTARVSLTPEPIPGDVYLLDVPGAALPGLGLSFTGRYAQRVTSTVRIDAAGRIVVRFPEIPDLPLRRLDMTIIGGPGGPLQNAAGRCPDGAQWDAAFLGQGGQASSHTIDAPCPLRAAKRAAVTLSSKRGLTLRLSDLGGRKLSSAKLTLPAGFAVDTAKAGRARLRSLTVAGGGGRVKTTARTVQVLPTSRNVTAVTLRLGTGTIRRLGTPTSTASRSVLLPLRLAFTDGTVQRQRIRVRAS